MRQNREKTGQGFEKTPWTIVRALCNGDQLSRDRALQTLSETYWPALYTWTRLRGVPRDRALDLTQSFFAERILGGHLFQNADPARGKLRSYILTVYRNFCIDEHRKGKHLRDLKFIPLSLLDREEGLLRMIKHGHDPDDFYHRRWMLASLDEAIRRTRAYYLELNKERHWEAFEKRVLNPARSGLEAPRCESIAVQLGFRTGADVASAVRVVKIRLRTLMREVIVEASMNPREAEEDISLLRNFVAN